MNLDLREFESFPADVNREYEADNADYGVSSVSFSDVMRLRISIQMVSEEYYCQGEVSIKVEQECARCLNNFESELTGDLHFIVRPESGKKIGAADIGEDVVYIKKNEPVVVMNDLIRQALDLSLPLKPLCSEECRGLCPNCGVNLNEESCDCKKEHYNDKWEGLEGLLE